MMTKCPNFCKVLTLFLVLAQSYPAWAKLYGTNFCHYPGFNCHKVKSKDSWASLFPNQVIRNLVKRLNRINTELYPGLMIAIPEDLESSKVMDLSPLPQQIEAPSEKLIMIDPADLAWGAYDIDGSLVRWGPISAGADWCKDIDGPCRTEEGTFRIFSLGSSDCYSTKFPLPKGGAPMPYCMYFYGGQAIHGEPNGLPGYNASHGCVRLFVNDAEWLRYSFVEGPNVNNHYQGTKVIVKPY